MGAQEDKVYTRTNQDKEPVVLPTYGRVRGREQLGSGGVILSPDQQVSWRESPGPKGRR